MSGGGHGHGSPLPGYQYIVDAMQAVRDKTGQTYEGGPIAAIGLAIFIVSFLFAPTVVATALSIALFLTPIWLPYLLVSAAWKEWIILKRAQFIANTPVMLLEIIPPRSIERTPLAMETVLAGLHLSGGESSWWAVYFKGSQRPWWSLEIASLEGKVHFYVWARSAFRRQIESQIYAQYPGAQVIEVRDYTREISGHTGEWEIWGCEYKKRDADPVPIKTYVDYGLDSVAKEPEQTDPIANMLEFMGALGKGEYFWLQIMIRANKNEKYKGVLNAAGKQYTWRDEAKEKIEEIRKQTVRVIKQVDPATGKVNETETFPNPSKGQQEMIAAIERNVSKLAFDVGFRAMYIARPENFQGTTISGMSALFKQVNSESYNTIGWTRGMLGFDDYPWERNVEKRKDHRRHLLIDAYRRRSFFYHPHEEPFNIMSTEELATIYHIPSGAVSTPTLGRIQSSTSEAPAGLPT